MGRKANPNTVKKAPAVTISTPVDSGAFKISTFSVSERKAGRGGSGVRPAYSFNAPVGFVGADAAVNMNEAISFAGSVETLLEQWLIGIRKSTQKNAVPKRPGADPFFSAAKKEIYAALQSRGKDPKNVDQVKLTAAISARAVALKASAEASVADLV